MIVWKMLTVTMMLISKLKWTSTGTPSFTSWEVVIEEILGSRNTPTRILTRRSHAASPAFTMEKIHQELHQQQPKACICILHLHKTRQTASLSAKFAFAPIPDRSPQQYQRQICDIVMLLLQLLQWRKSIKNCISSSQRLAFAFFICTNPAKQRHYQPNSPSLQSQIDRHSNTNGSFAT